MFGVVLVVLAILVVIPVGVLISGGALAGIIGYFLQKDVDEENEGSELVGLNG